MTAEKDVHEHEHESHYHGEPSRILKGDPYPEAVVFFRISSEDENHDSGNHLQQLQHIPGVKRVFVPESYRGNTDVDESLDLHFVAVEQLNPLHENFKGMADPLKKEPSLLFYPAEMEVDPAIWKDLTENDVSVNWMAVDPAEKAEGIGAVVVLSDWIMTVDPELPPGRSSGEAMGIFHLTAKWYESFEEGSTGQNSLNGLLNDLLNEENIKFRPGFIRGRDWKINL